MTARDNRQINRRSVLLGMSMMGAMAALPAYAADDLEKLVINARTKVALAGDLPMLSQRIARAAMYIGNGIETEHHTLMLARARADYAFALTTLRNGDRLLGTMKENNRLPLKRLDDIDKIWKHVEAAATRIVATGSVDKTSLLAINKLNEPLRKASERAAQIFAATYSGSANSSRLAIAVEVLGRQRMLTQKLAKNAAALTLNPGDSTNLAELNESLELFDLSQRALKEGLPTISLSAPPNEEARKLVQRMSEEWDKCRPLLKVAANENTSTESELLELGTICDQLLLTSTDALEAYKLAPSN